MKTKAISHVWACTRCGSENEIYNEISFKNFCLDLMSGKTGLVICRSCGQTDQVVFRDSTLELVVAAG